MAKEFGVDSSDSESVSAALAEDPTAEVIADVAHTEPAAHVNLQEGAQLEAARWASWVEHNVDGGFDTANESLLQTQFVARYEPVVLLKLTRFPRRLQDRLHSGEELEHVRAALQFDGYNPRLPSGASVFVAPDQYTAVRQAVAR